MAKRSVLLVALGLATTGFADSLPEISLDSLKRAIADKDVTILDVNGRQPISRWLTISSKGMPLEPRRSW